MLALCEGENNIEIILMEELRNGLVNDSCITIVRQLYGSCMGEVEEWFSSDR